jgi:hypothetical protein
MTTRETQEFIDSIDWDDLLPKHLRDAGVKVEAEPKAKREVEAEPKRVLEVIPGSGLSIDGERERQARHAKELIKREKEWAEAAKHNRVWLEEMRRIGEYHAGMKRMHMEAEYWARENRRDRGGYDPIRLFQNEIEAEGE